MINMKQLLEGGNETSAPRKLTVYHGTGTRFKKFNLKKSAQGIVWFTSKKENILDGDVGASGKGYIITAEVTFNNPMGWKEYGQLGLWEVEREGYDGAILPNDRGFDCFVMNPSQIKILSIERVNATAPSVSEMLTSNISITEGLRLDQINAKIQELEVEWERLDTQGVNQPRQFEISRELQKLNLEKQNWEKIYSAINETIYTENVIMGGVFHDGSVVAIHGNYHSTGHTQNMGRDRWVYVPSEKTVYWWICPPLEESRIYVIDYLEQRGYDVKNHEHMMKIWGQYD